MSGIRMEGLLMECLFKVKNGKNLVAPLANQNVFNFGEREIGMEHLAVGAPEIDHPPPGKVIAFFGDGESL